MVRHEHPDRNDVVRAGDHGIGRHRDLESSRRSSNCRDSRRSLPITSVRSVDLVVTELAAIAFQGGRATLLETGPGVSVAQVVAATESELVVPNEVPEMTL
jgi:acyl CoA:acetate/3-ketoacid CoA transferase beta subunit